ncbi:MAG: glycosyltransferase [Patescibacteria group bacterium]|jgi:glycosyltransferase involved in cell wall biosynthesis
MKIVIAIPAYNEEKILEKNVLKIFEFCKNNLAGDWQIVIADNKSIDQTSAIGKNLASRHPEIKYLFVGVKGKGAAIKAAWQDFSADVYCFMDADLATDLAALPLLFSGIGEGSDIVIGSRFHSGSQVERSLVRRVFSLGYHLALKILLQTKIKDMPCGFKAINSKIKESLLPLVLDNEWFFDSELVILAEKKGYKIKEIPVVWHDPREGFDKSRVKPVSLALAYFKKILILKKRLKQ